MLHKFRRLLCFDTTNRRGPQAAADPWAKLCGRASSSGERAAHLPDHQAGGWNSQLPTTVICRVSTISLKVRRVSRLINANYEKRLPSSFSLYKRSSHFDFHIARESQGKNTKNKSNKYTKAGKTKAPKRENNGKHFTGLSLSLLPPNRNGPRRSCSFSRLH